VNHSANLGIVFFIKIKLYYKLVGSIMTFACMCKVLWYYLPFIALICHPPPPCFALLPQIVLSLGSCLFVYLYLWK
jgi:hypothetical protein